MIKRIFNKIKHLAYYYSHPFLWGKNVQINGIPTIGNPKNFHLGKHVSLNDKCYIQSVGGVKLGNYVTISYGVTILTSGLDSKDYPDTCNCKNRKHLVAPVAIGDGVWLCANVTVTPGITIAPTIIVAAGSVVTKDLDKEGWLYGGVPAKPIKPLNK